MPRVMSYKKIQLGELIAHQFAIIESKRLFSIIFYYFEGHGWQDRFHTHAFSAISLRIFGTYLYRNFDDDVDRTRSKRIMYFPKTTNHMLGPSKGCLTLLFARPWERTWNEFKDGKVRVLTWGRRNANTS